MSHFTPPAQKSLIDGALEVYGSKPLKGFRLADSAATGKEPWTGPPKPGIMAAWMNQFRSK